MASPPHVLVTRRIADAMACSASSQLARANWLLPFGPDRSDGNRRRASPYRRSGNRRTLAQMTPAVAGCRWEPSRLSTWPWFTRTVRLHESGQSSGQAVSMTCSCPDRRRSDFIGPVYGRRCLFRPATRPEGVERATPSFRVKRRQAPRLPVGRLRYASGRGASTPRRPVVVFVRGALMPTTVETIASFLMLRGFFSRACAVLPVGLSATEAEGHRVIPHLRDHGFFRLRGLARRERGR